MIGTSQAPPRVPSSVRDPAAAQWALTGLALMFLGLFLVVPLAAIFVQALENGVEGYVRAVAEPDALHALKLTLLTAAVAVPLNAVFGVAAAWAIARFDFRGKATLVTLIDLPFAVSPVIAGLVFVLLFGAPRRLRLLEQARDGLPGRARLPLLDRRHDPEARCRADRPDPGGGLAIGRRVSGDGDLRAG